MLLNISCRFVNLAYFRSGIGNVVVKLKAGFCISDRLVAADIEPQADLEAFKSFGFIWGLVLYRTGTIDWPLIWRRDQYELQVDRDLSEGPHGEARQWYQQQQCRWERLQNPSAGTSREQFGCVETLASTAVSNADTTMAGAQPRHWPLGQAIPCLLAADGEPCLPGKCVKSHGLESWYSSFGTYVSDALLNYLTAEIYWNIATISILSWV